MSFLRPYSLGNRVLLVLSSALFLFIFVRQRFYIYRGIGLVCEAPADESAIDGRVLEFGKKYGSMLCGRIFGRKDGVESR